MIGGCNGLDRADGACMSLNNTYILFAGHHYYPRGGIEDAQGSFFSVDEAIMAFRIYIKDSKDYVCHWGQIVERASLTTIHELDADRSLNGPVITVDGKALA